MIDLMSRSQVVELDVELAASAATLAHREKLGMADAIILATAMKFDATIWTQGADLKRFDRVKFCEKPQAS